MPRGTLTQGRGKFHQIQRQARQLLRRLTREIRIKEVELRSLRDDEAKLRGHWSATRAFHGSHHSGPRKSSSRINWLAVLERLPKEFKASHTERGYSNELAQKGRSTAAGPLVQGGHHDCPE
jgi:hypothetical protein